MHCLEMINTFAREVENRDPQFPFEAIGRGRTSTPADWKTTCKRTDNKDDNQHPVSKEIDRCIPDAELQGGLHKIREGERKIEARPPRDHEIHSQKARIQ